MSGSALSGLPRLGRSCHAVDVDARIVQRLGRFCHAVDVDARIVPLDAVKAVNEVKLITLDAVKAVNGMKLMKRVAVKVNEMKFMPLEAVKHLGASYPFLQYVDWTSGPE